MRTTSGTGPTVARLRNPICPGFPGTKTSNPSVWWNDEPLGETPGSTDGCAQVTTIDGTPLTNDASLIVVARKGSKFEIQCQIQDVGGATGIQYRSDKFVITRPDAPFTGAGYTLHVDEDVDIYKLKGHTGGGKDAFVGTIRIDDIVYE